MKKGQILEGYIERVDFPNKGFAVVEDEEKKVIVKNTGRMSAGMSAFWSLWRMHLSESAV